MTRPRLVRASLVGPARHTLLDAAILLVLGLVVLVPTWLVLPPDDEDLSKEIVATVIQSKALFSGHYPFWNPIQAFGVPQPLSQSLIYHPFLLFAEIFPLATAIAAFYQFQLWVGVFAVWLLTRHLRVGRWISLLCAVGYVLSTRTITYLVNFWPVIFVQWTLAPVVLLLLVKLIDAKDRWSRALLSTGLGLSIALFVLDGHAGLMPDYTIGFVAFVAAEGRLVYRLLPWLGLGLAIAGALTASRIYDIGLEASRSTAPRHQDVQGLDFAQLLLYPIGSPQGHYEIRAVIAIGAPMVVLAVVGLLWRGLRGPHVNALRAGIVASFLLWFLPTRLITIRSANYFSGDLLILFSLLLAGLCLHALWAQGSRRRRRVLGAAVALELVILVAGFLPFYRAEIQDARALNDGKPQKSLRSVLKDRPIYAYMRELPGIATTRVYLGKQAEERLSGRLDYALPGWTLHGLRLANGVFKGIEMSELDPTDKAMKSEIKGNDRVSESAQALDALNIGYVLATPDDRVPRSLQRLRTFRLKHPDTLIGVYRNPAAWTDTVLLAPKARSLGTLPRRPGCDKAGLLCADFRPVARLREKRAARSSAWHQATLDVSFPKSSGSSVLMMSQLYRPGWRAKLSDGTTARGYRLLGGFTGFDIGPHVTSASVSFRPEARMALTALTWIGLAVALVAFAVLGVLRRRRVRP
jgi:hypothetical protein